MSESKFPLCEAAGLKVSDWVNLSGYVIPAADVEAMLREAPVVWFNDDKTMSPYWECSSRQDKQHTHSARLLLIQPIVCDTAESLLRDMLKWRDSGNGLTLEMHAYLERARKLLEGK